MPDLETLRDLEARLVKAEGSSQELECAIFDTLEVYRIAGWRVDLDPDGKAISGPPVTASVDLVLALIEEKLPGWAWILQKIEGIETRKYPCEAELWIPSQRTQGLRVERVNGEGNTPALAACIALVRALIAMEEGQPVQEGESGE